MFVVEILPCGSWNSSWWVPCRWNLRFGHWICLVWQQRRGLRCKQSEQPKVYVGLLFTSPWSPNFRSWLTLQTDSGVAFPEPKAFSRCLQSHSSSETTIITVFLSLPGSAFLRSEVNLSMAKSWRQRKSCPLPSNASKSVHLMININLLTRNKGEFKGQII